MATQIDLGEPILDFGARIAKYRSFSIFAFCFLPFDFSSAIFTARMVIVR